MAVFSGYFALCLIYFYPLLNGSEAPVIGDRDSFYFLWDIWWFKHSLLEKASNPLTSNAIFFPNENVPVPWSSPINELIGALLCYIMGPRLALNLLTVASFPLAGYFTFLFLSGMTLNPWASFISGFIFSFSTYHFIHANQLGLTTIQWIPLFLIALNRYLKRPHFRQGLWLILSAWLVALSDPYTLVYFLIFFLIYLAFFEGRTAFCLLISIAVLIAPFYIPMALSLAKMKGAQSLSVEAVTYSQDLLKYLIPWKKHPIWGSLFADFFAGDTIIELFPGYIPIILAIVAVRKRWGKNSQVRFWLIFGLIALILSLGPYLKINGPTWIPMPYWLLWKLPFFSFFRMPQRFALSVNLALCILAAFGLTEVFRRVKKKETISVLTTVLLVGIGFEYLMHLPFPVSSGRIPDIYGFLRETTVPDKGALLELPLGNEDDIYRYMFYQTMHGKRIVNGGLPRDPDWALDFQGETPFLQEIGAPEGLLFGDIVPRSPNSTRVSILTEYLRENGVSFIVIHKRAYSGTGIEAAFRQALGIPFFEDPESACFRIKGKGVKKLEDTAPILSLGRGWHGLRMFKGGPYRWMGERGELKVVGNPEIRAARLKASLIKEFPSAKTLRVFLNNDFLEDIDISALPYTGAVLTKPFLLPRGDSIISLSVAEGPFSPYKEKGIPDPRRISMGVSRIEIY